MKNTIKEQWKVNPKSIKNPPKIDLGGLFWGLLGGSWTSWGHLGGLLGASWGPLGASWGPLGRLLVANMAPSWPPKRSQNRSKIEAKIDQFFNASWDPIFGRFWWILEPKWKQVGLQNRTQNDVIFKRRFFEKTLFFLRKNNDFEGSGDGSWDQKSINNRSKNHVNMRRHLGLDFSSILMDLGGQVGTKLAPKFGQIGYQTIIKKMIKKTDSQVTRLIWVLAPNIPSESSNPEVQRVQRTKGQSNALETLHFMPWGHGAGYTVVSWIIRNMKYVYTAHTWYIMHNT